MIGTTQIIIIVAVILILFGATAIPRFARSLGKAKKEFEKGLKEGLAEGEEEAGKKTKKPGKAKK
jgi:sec-independent protein translocase protein TatA